MKFLIDNALSPKIAEGLRAAGFDATHVLDLALHAEPDEVLFERAAREGRILVSADTDFGTLLARQGSRAPSVIIFRCSTGRKPDQQLAALVTVLAQVATELEAGSIVVIEDTRLRLRKLPIDR